MSIGIDIRGGSSNETKLYQLLKTKPSGAALSEESMKVVHHLERHTSILRVLYVVMMVIKKRRGGIKSGFSCLQEKYIKYLLNRS